MSAPAWSEAAGAAEPAARERQQWLAERAAGAVGRGWAAWAMLGTVEVLAVPGESCLARRAADGTAMLAVPAEWLGRAGWATAHRIEAEPCWALSRPGIGGALVLAIGDCPVLDRLSDSEDEIAIASYTSRGGVYTIEHTHLPIVDHDSTTDFAASLHALYPA